MFTLDSKGRGAFASLNCCHLGPIKKKSEVNSYSYKMDPTFLSFLLLTPTSKISTMALYMPRLLSSIKLDLFSTEIIWRAISSLWLAFNPVTLQKPSWHLTAWEYPTVPFHLQTKVQAFCFQQRPAGSLFCFGSAHSGHATKMPHSLPSEASPTTLENVSSSSTPTSSLPRLLWHPASFCHYLIITSLSP